MSAVLWIFIPSSKISRFTCTCCIRNAGSRVQNQMICPVCKAVVERDDLLRGFELSKGNYVQITEVELESVEAEANNGIEFRELVPVDKIDPVYFDSSYYLAPSKGAEKPYRLMAETPEKIGRVASADRFSRERKPYGCPLDEQRCCHALSVFRERGARFRADFEERCKVPET
ncbi:MAG: Ku protein [Candidatus Binatia bacterium]